jgi:hypothetical protein
MALLGNTFKGWGGGFLVGVGAALVAPVLLPAAATALRPLAKELIKGSLFVADSLQELLAEGEEHLSDLVAEARAEYKASTTPFASATTESAATDSMEAQTSLD